MKTTNLDNVLTIFLEGRIDSSNSSQIGEEINNLLDNETFDYVVFDAEKLEYISSAGLRVILSVRKKIPALKIVNVVSEVYDIFEMTGFTEMIDIKKAYRVVSVDGCEVIGQGANGKVYRIDPDTIIKVYLNPDSLPDIHRERELARLALVLGVPTAIPFDVVKVAGGGYGSVFELLNAKSLAKLIIANPEDVDTYVRYSVDLLKTIHSTVVKPTDMPNMKEVAVDWANFMRDYLPSEDAEKLCALISSIPEDCHMMHGDYHIKNVMIQNGEVLLIDMDTLCYGNPIFEFASIYNAYKGFSELDSTKVTEFLGISENVANYILEKTVKLYFDTEDMTKVAEIIDKSRVIGYTRLIRRSIRRGGLEKEPELIKHYTSELLELLSRIDTLSL